MRRTCTGFVLPLEHPSGTNCKYVNSPQLERFLDKNDKSPIRLFQCFCFPDLHEAVNGHVETDGSYFILFGAWLLVRLLQPLLLVEVRALYYSPLGFQPNPSLTILFDFFRLAIADKNGHNPSFFAKAFESILWHLLRDKMTPLYLVICSVTSYQLPQNDRTCQRVIKTINV